MFRAVVRCSALFLLFFLAVSLYAQQFSADIVDLGAEHRGGLSKVFASNDNLRLEMQDRGSAGNVAMIWNLAKQTRFILMTDRHMYMDYTPLLAAKFSMVPIWHPSDINDACPEWKKFAEQYKSSKWGTCRKVGSDTVNGRSAIKYTGTSTDGKTANVWIDSKLRYVSKYQSEDGGMELRNIEEVAQPASLFEIPPGYQKFDMSGMGMRQH